MALVGADQADFLFSMDSLPPDELRVLRFSGREEVSRFFAYEVELVSSDPDLDVEKYPGSAASLRLRGPTGERQVHGVVESFELKAAGRRFTLFQARLVPSLAPLSYIRRSRIHRQQSVPEIVATVLREAGFSDDRLRLALEDESVYEKRDYCVQYQESCIDFISRLLEEEGIFFFFDQSSDTDVLVLADSSHGTAPMAGPGVIPFRDESSASILEEEQLYRFSSAARIVPGRVTMRDFAFKQPDLDLDASEPGPAFRDLEVYDFPGEYVDPDLGRRLAKVRLEELQAQRNRLRGIGTVRGFQAGHRFRLENHPRDAFNQEYFVVGLEQEGSQPQALLEEHGAGQVREKSYTCRVDCLPTRIPFRPERRTPRPRIPGLQSAVVTGPKGQEIHCDEHGRVSVQFRWDREGKRDDHSSCWVRVSQQWAGVSFGSIFLPRVGQEVLVQFLEGDPDRPVIVGRVYNGENPVPNPLPAGKTRSTIRSQSSPGRDGFNELSFEDQKGEEEVFLHAQRDLNEVVLRNHSTTVNADQSNSVGGNQSNSVTGNQSEDIQKDQSMTVTGKRTHLVVKDEEVTVDGKRTVTVRQDHVETVTEGNKTVTVATGGRQTDVKQKDGLTVGAEHTVDVGTFYTLTTRNNATVTSNEGDVLVQAPTSKVKLEAASEVSGMAETIVLQGDQKVEIRAGMEIVISVGGSSITITPEGVTISGPKVSSTAIGIHEISGALIKIN